MRLSDDAREAMREALILRIGDREADESREERDARTAPAEAALAWLDAPGIKLSVSPEDYSNIVGALDYTAEDYAERANYEAKSSSDNEEQVEYEGAADMYSETLARLEEDKA